MREEEKIFKNKKNYYHIFFSSKLHLNGKQNLQLLGGIFVWEFCSVENEDIKTLECHSCMKCMR